MMMKHVFFDIDGTLVGKSRQVTPKTIQKIQEVRAAGNKVYICTGRAPVSIMKRIKDIGFDGIISSAGGFIQLGNEYIFENFINQYILQEMMTLFINNKILFSLETKEALYQSPGVRDFFKEKHKGVTKNNPELARLLEERENEEIRLPLSEFDILTTKVTKIVFISRDKYAFYDVVKYIRDYFNIVLFSKDSDDFINGEIILRNCTKGDAVKRIIEYTGSRMQDTIGFGDSMNDYQMIETVDYGIVAYNAPEKLKIIADDFFDDPDDDGIFKSLEKIDWE